MKPAPFNYVRPGTLSDAVRLLAKENLDARVINGGQSLVPMLNLRLATAELLVDVSKIAEIAEIRDEGDRIIIGAAVKHNTILHSELVGRKLPLLAEAYRHVAHHSVRNRGTLGGSLCHADPAAEMPMIMAVLEATLIATGPDGQREIAVRDFFRGAFETALEHGELLTSISIPVPPPGHGACFDEISQRHGDFALAAVGCVVVVKERVCTDIRVGYRGIGDAIFRLPEVEAVLRGKVPDTDLIKDMGKVARSLARPNSDIHADEAYRLDLADTLTRRVVSKALKRCIG